MELEDIVYELACLHESMLFCCEDRSGRRIRSSPITAWRWEGSSGISKRPSDASGPKRPTPNPVNRKTPRETGLFT